MLKNRYSQPGFVPSAEKTKKVNQRKQRVEEHFCFFWGGGRAGVAKGTSSVYKSGTGTMGWGYWDACVETWDLGRRGEGRGDAEGKVGGKCEIFFFVKMCYLWSTLTAFDSK